MSGLADPSPPNDHFADAYILSTSTGGTSGNNIGATKQPGELHHAGNAGGSSVWWWWTAPSSGQTVFDTFGSNFDTMLAVYTGGSVDSLVLVGANDDTDAVLRVSRVVFNAVAGTTYRIAVDGYDGDQGNIALNWDLLVPPNDHFADAYILSTSTGGTSGNNINATKQPGELHHAGNAGGSSVWWWWTAPSSGETVFDTFGSNFDTTLAVYTGGSVDSLVLVGANDDSGSTWQSRVVFNAVAGTTYRIAVDGFDGVQGNIVLNWSPNNMDFTVSQIAVPIEAEDVWHLRYRGAHVDVGRAIWSGSQFVGVGGGWDPELEEDRAIILTSPDGIAWTQRNSGISGRLYDVIWTGNQFVAVGSRHTPQGQVAVVLTSPDGIAWTQRDSGVFGQLRSVLWSGIQFVAVGEGWDPITYQSKAIILSSPDGVTWTRQDAGNAYRLSTVIWAGSQFVAVGENRSHITNDSAAILTSLDGIVWVQRNAGISGWLNDVVWSGSQFVAVGEGCDPITGQPEAIVVSSPDGKSWTKRDAGNSGGFTSVTWNGILFATVGVNLFDFDTDEWWAAILTSPDGVTWTERDVGDSKSLNDVIWTGSQFVAVGGNRRDDETEQSSGALLTSPDGVTWKQRQLGVSSDLWQVIWNGNNLLAIGWEWGDDVGNKGVILQSEAAGPWSTAPTTGSQFLAAVTVKNDGNIVGYAGKLSVWKDSPDEQSCGVAPDASEDIGVLHPGESRTFAFPLAAGVAGLRTFRAFVDSQCQADESNEGNNQATSQYTVSPSAPQPRLSFQRLGENLLLSWEDPGTLQQAASLTGSPNDWTDVIGATSSFSVNTASGARFFRLKR